MLLKEADKQQYDRIVLPNNHMIKGCSTSDGNCICFRNLQGSSSFQHHPVSVYLKAKNSYGFQWISLDETEITPYRIMEYTKLLKFHGEVEHISLMKPKICIFSIIVIVIAID